MGVATEKDSLRVGNSGERVAEDNVFTKNQDGADGHVNDKGGPENGGAPARR